MGRLRDLGIRARIRLTMCIPLDVPLDHCGRFDSMDRPANAQICMSVCFVHTNTGRQAMALYQVNRLFIPWVFLDHECNEPLTTDARA